MTADAERDAEAACLGSLEAALAGGGLPDLTRWSANVLDRALRTLVTRHGGEAVPLLRAIADRASAKDLRRTARRAIYRLGQAGVTVPPAAVPAAEPVVRRQAERPVRAWLSGIDGTGSRAVWILFEGGLGGQLSLCSLILNDEAGILEAAGGAITRKRLDVELRRLRQDQKLPWVETDAEEAYARVEEALALHARSGTTPVAEFARWRRFFGAEPKAPRLSAPPPGDLDPALVERSAELAELPEMSGWFVDPASIHEDAVALLQARESRLVVSEQIRAEREAAIVDAVIDRSIAGDSRQRWARRLVEMASIFRATGREEPARLADSTAAALEDEGRAARGIPFARALAARGLEMGAEVVLGRVKLAEVSRAPARRSSG